MHWFDQPIPNGGSPKFDLLPDVSDYTAEELYPAPGLTLSDGQPAKLFSSAIRNRFSAISNGWRSMALTVPSFNTVALKFKVTVD